MKTLSDLKELAESLPSIPDGRPEWLKVLLPEANAYHRFIYEFSKRMKPRFSWEIGSCDGAGASHMAEGNRDGVVVTVDIDPGCKSKVDSLFVPNVIALLGDSLEVLERVRWKPQIDLLFIDGEHSRTRVEAEYAAYRKLVRPGGFILMDDIRLTSEMVEAWDAISDPKVNLDNLHFSGFGITQVAED